MQRDRAEYNPGKSPGAAALTPDEFALRFQASGRLLWTVAAAVLGDSSEADDVLQEAGMMALAKLDQYQAETNFQAWMAQFVRNVALNHGRRQQRRGPLLLESEDGPLVPRAASLQAALEAPVNRNGELHLDQQAFDDEVLAGLRSLSANQRSCLLLRTVMELSYREIAETLGLPEGTAMSHVHRGRALLRERLIAGARDPLFLKELG